MKIIKFLLIVLVIIILCVIFIFCKDNRMNKHEIEELINKNLKPGDSEEKIISFLKSQGWLYGFDEFKNRFQVDCPNSEEKNYIIGKKGLQIYIYVDESKSFTKAEVIWVSTGL